MNQRINSIITSFLIIIIFQCPSFSQNPYDCIYAKEVCDYSTIEINLPDTAGTIVEELGELCSSSFPPDYFELNTVWFKYQFQSAGDFLFTITSAIPESDIDFVVFKSELKSCDDLVAVRCMFTGQNFPGPSDPVCSGPTGLSSNSTDTEELPGCQIGDDNFLAPLQVMNGEVYYMAVQLFSSPEINNFTIQHSGSAELTCMPVGVEELYENDIILYPTLATDRIFIEIKKPESEAFSLELFNHTGEKISSYQFKDRLELDVQSLPKGIYYTRIYSSKSKFYLRKFIKTD